MRFPKAYAGVKKIFTSEILSLISTILLVVVAAVAAVNESGELSSGKDGAIAVIAIVGLIALVLGLIATILQLVGLHSASKNEHAFKTAFFFALIMLIITGVGGAVATKNEDSIISDIPSLLNIFVFLFTVSGISNLARKLGREDMASFGTKILGLQIILSILSFVLQVFKTGSMENVLSVVAILLTAIVYIIYLIYLAKAKKMLQA